MTLQVPTIICIGCGAQMNFITERRFTAPDMYEYVCTCGKSEVVDISILAMDRADSRITD
jgi:hypothetical protein